MTETETASPIARFTTPSDTLPGVAASPIVRTITIAMEANRIRLKINSMTILGQKLPAPFLKNSSEPVPAALLLSNPKIPAVIKAFRKNPAR